MTPPLWRHPEHLHVFELGQPKGSPPCSLDLSLLSPSKFQLWTFIELSLDTSELNLL